jgi:hypothetical protein
LNEAGAPMWRGFSIRALLTHALYEAARSLLLLRRIRGNKRMASKTDTINTVSASGQAVTIFRDMLVLPLRLTRRDDRDQLRSVFDALAPDEWEKSADNVAFAGPSRIWPIPDERVREAAAKAAAEQSAPDQAEDYALRQAYGEAAYFHPYVQRYLYGFGAKVGEEPLSTRCHALIKGMRVRMDYYHPKSAGLVDASPAAASFQIDLAVERIELHHAAEPGLIVLILEYAADGRSPLRRFAIDGKELDGQHCLSLAEVLALKDGVRRLYPPFFERLHGQGANAPAARWAENLFPAAVTFLDKGGNAHGEAAMTGTEAYAMASALVRGGKQPIAPWWRGLLKPLLVDSKAVPGTPLLEQVVDERMPTLSFVAVPSLAALSPSDTIRLCFADGPGKGLPYDKDFLADFAGKHAYDRFKDSGTRYLFSSYSLTAVAQTGVAPGQRSGNFDFALDVIQEHARRHYLRMFMLAHMQRASLLAFSNWISAAMQESRTLRDHRYREQIDDLRRGFAEFCQVSWFSNLSNQEQARDMFALLQKHLGNAELQTEVSAELDGARAVLTEIDEERQSESATIFNVIAGTATLTGLPAGVMAAAKQVQPHWTWPGAWFLPAMGLASFTAAVLVVLLARYQTLGPKWLHPVLGKTAGLLTAYLVGAANLVLALLFLRAWLAG